MTHSYLHVSTGAMHNHEALCAHTDANKSLPVETLTLYPRLPDTDEIYKKTKSDLTPGYLIFPLYGFNIEMECGYSILHCSLRAQFISLIIQGLCPTGPKFMVHSYVFVNNENQHIYCVYLWSSFIMLFVSCSKISVN